MQPLVIGNTDNEVLPTHPLYNIPPKSVIKAYVYAQDHTKENTDELIGSNENAADDCGHSSKSQSAEKDQLSSQVSDGDNDDAMIEEENKPNSNPMYDTC